MIDAQNPDLMTSPGAHLSDPQDKKYPTVKTCEIMQYWQYMDTQSMDEVISRIRSLKQIKTWCIITHDKDLLPDGKLFVEAINKCHGRIVQSIDFISLYTFPYIV